MSKKYSYIDLFCGAGGFSKGFEIEGFENIFALDSEYDFCRTYQTNFPNHTLVEKKIEDVTSTEIIELVGKKEVDVIIGGPPCQGFSMAGNIGRKFLDDPRNKLFTEMVRIVEIVKPKIVVIENVARLYTHNENRSRNEIINSFHDQGYNIDCKILNAVDYNVPQNRRRVFFIASRISSDIKFPDGKSKPKTIKSAIDNLPLIKSGQSSLIPNHVAMNHSEQMLCKMSFIKNGGDRSAIPKNIRPKSGDIRKYIRYDSEKPAVTITGDMRKVFHYKLNRALTVRELARIQTFEDDFNFEGKSISQQQQVGNAVPPLLARAVAKKIKEMLQDG